MPPWRTTLEIRAASMPDSRATMASASSEVWRCWVSKSAGTYSASITGVIGNTLSRRTAPCQVCDSVAAVAIAGFARSVSARSIGTRMDLNICASQSVTNIAHIERRTGPAQSSQNPDRPKILIVQSLLQQFRADEQHEPSAAECHIGPVVGREIENRQPRCRQIVGQRAPSGGVAAAVGQRQRQFMHARIVPDQEQPLRIAGCDVADAL